MESPNNNWWSLSLLHHSSKEPAERNEVYGSGTKFYSNSELVKNAMTTKATLSETNVPNAGLKRIVNTDDSVKVPVQLNGFGKQLIF